MLRLTEENFKATSITILNEVKHNMFSVNKTLRRQTNFIRENEKKDQIEILKLKIKISETKFTGWTYSQMEITEEKINELKVQQSSKTSSKVNNKEKMI